MKLIYVAVFGTIISTTNFALTVDAENNKRPSALKKITTFFEDVGEKLLPSKGLDEGLSNSSTILSHFKLRLKAIFPGTLWCGDGSIAKSNDELGYFKSADNCCREHDNCQDIIEAGDSNYGLTNSGLFTRSNCSCDEKFHHCLKSSKSLVATKIGFTYFTLLGPQCFKYEYPIVKCKKRNLLRCVKYQYNYTENEKYQWFDNPYY